MPEPDGQEESEGQMKSVTHIRDESRMPAEYSLCGLELRAAQDAGDNWYSEVADFSGFVEATCERCIKIKDKVPA